jgi:hypothetical protein
MCTVLLPPGVNPIAVIIIIIIIIIKEQPECYKNFGLQIMVRGATETH